jgi:NitT/TauT family transport system ATP-binding protein
MNDSEPMFEACAASVEFKGGIKALERVDFAASAGSFTSLVGPSGCGKSTLLRLAAGLARPTAGSVKVAGMTPANARRVARMSLVFQDPTLLPWRSVAENVRLPLELSPRSPDAERQAIERGLEMVGLTQFAGRFPNQLSGGMRMRVSLARALAVEPRLLLLDEPFAALDDITRQALGEELVQIWTRDRWTAIFVTHNIAEAVFLSQRVVVMSARPGRIIADVPIELPAARSPELRGEPAFARLVGHVGALLRRSAA